MSRWYLNVKESISASVIVWSQRDDFIDRGHRRVCVWVSERSSVHNLLGRGWNDVEGVRLKGTELRALDDGEGKTLMLQETLDNVLIKKLSQFLKSRIKMNSVVNFEHYDFLLNLSHVASNCNILNIHQWISINNNLFIGKLFIFNCWDFEVICFKF